jgi:hypothetical protein
MENLVCELDIVRQELASIRRKLNAGNFTDFEVTRLCYVRDLLLNRLNELEKFEEFILTHCCEE